MKKLMMLFAAAAAAFGAWAETWTDPDTGYRWTYRINGDTAEIYGYTSNGDIYPAISPNPTGAVTIPSTLGGKPVTRWGAAILAALPDLEGKNGGISQASPPLQFAVAIWYNSRVFGRVPRGEVWFGTDWKRQARCA